MEQHVEQGRFFNSSSSGAEAGVAPVPAATSGHSTPRKAPAAAAAAAGPKERAAAAAAGPRPSGSARRPGTAGGGALPSSLSGPAGEALVEDIVRKVVQELAKRAERQQALAGAPGRASDLASICAFHLPGHLPCPPPLLLLFFVPAIAGWLGPCLVLAQQP